MGCLGERGAADGVVLLAGALESPINYAANCHPFRQDSNWLYFMGVNEPGMLAIIEPGSGKTFLYGEESSLDDMIWTGPRPSLSEFAESCGAIAGGTIGDCRERLKAASRGKAPVRWLPPYRKDAEDLLADLTGLMPGELRQKADGDLVRAVISLREIKEEREIRELEAAVAVSVEMHSAVLRDLRAGWTESRAAARARWEAESRGCSLSFATIATTHGEVLHNHVGQDVCADGGMFLLDAGAETASGYAGDLTTSFPVGKRFDSRRREMYLVLSQMFSAAVACLGPGIRFSDAHLAASLALAKGLRSLSIMKGDPEEAVREGAHALFFPHGLGHMIGLDVHDMEGLGEDLVGYSDRPRSGQFGLASLRLAKELRPGMVHSVEPGLYFIPGLIEKWRGEGLHSRFIDYNEVGKWEFLGGMRLEEDWLVLGKGARRLGPAFDRSVEAIESVRSMV